MAVQTIVDVALVPADSTQPGGAQVTIVSYQVTGKAMHVVMLPSATPTLAQVDAAIVADVAFRNTFQGQTVKT